MSIRDRLIRVFQESFDLPGETDVPALAYRGIPAWNSVGHMQLVAALEAEFDLMLETDDIIAMSSFTEVERVPLSAASPPAPDAPRPLAGKVALVTGAGRGIGWATAQRLAEAGASVVLNGLHDPEELAAKAARLEADFGVPCLIPADLARPAEISALFRTLHQRFRRLDILVGNAGILEDARLGMIADDSLERVMQVNLHGAIRTLQAATRLMRRGGSGGAVVLVSSIVGVRGNAGQAVYAASKAGLIGLALSAARELGPEGIRVNAVAPGYIETDMIRHLDPATDQARRASIALGRAGSADEVARAILFLVSDQAAYVTGQVLGVDGGMVL